MHQINDDIFEIHHQDVQDVKQQLHDWHSRGGAEPLCLSKGEHLSNTIRSNAYKKAQAQLSLKKLSRVLRIDADRKVAYVEPRVTMEELVKATLPYGLIPPVVPEFKGITVGGAIMGAALESSSHLYGQFNDICLAYEILLGDGSIVHASPTENVDLFYGISGSYGTLGIILMVEIKLIPAKSGVRLTYLSFASVGQAVDHMIQAHGKPHPPEYLEAVAFSLDQTVVIEGRLVENERPTFSLSKHWSPWFFQHIKDVVRKHPAGAQEILSVSDYLFRHDRGAFWMGAYALHGSMLLRYFLDMFGLCPKWFERWQSSRDPRIHGRLKDPGFLFRSLFGWAAASRHLYTLLHHNSEEWFADRFVIQDFYVPEGKIVEMTEHVLRDDQIAPLWLCPIKPTQTPQGMAPHQYTGKGLLFDLGVYGFPYNLGNAAEMTRKLEQSTHRYGGRKMLYGYTYCNEDEFWKIYPQAEYLRLREKYHADHAWPNITRKVLHPER